MRTLNLQREELEHIAGDDPALYTEGPLSRAGDISLSRNALGKPRVRYKDMMIFAEVYHHPGEPMQVHWMCPKCGPLNKKRMSTIRGDRKKIEYDPRQNTEDGGRLSVETFQCPWELESEGRRMEFGLGLCGLRLTIEDNIAREV
jgi:hypothetical protein